MPRESMSPRERWLAVLRREKPDRVPMDYWGTDETTRKLMQHLNCSSEREMLAKLHIDFVIKVKARYVGPALAQDRDVFGCIFQEVDYGTGVYRECISHPLAGCRSKADIEKKYTWPSPDWWDYRSIPEQIKGYEMYPVQGGEYEPFLLYKFLRGEEQAFIDLLVNPEIVHFCLDKLLDLAYQDALRIFEHLPGKVMLTYVAEDMGGQDDLLFSPETIREFFIPRMRRMIDLAHQAGAFVFHHNDGSIRRIIAEMIDAGIDILNPIQWRSRGMDRKGLKEEFGKNIIFHGGMDNQHTLAFGSKKEVLQEVQDNLRFLGKGGGYILAPCHNIQAITPVENIIAMYDSCFEQGWT